MSIIDTPRIVGVSILLAIIATRVACVKDVLASRNELAAEHAYRWRSVLLE